MEQDLDDLAEEVRDHSDFARFVDAMADDLAANPQDWENRSLETFLGAMSDFVVSIESWARNNGEEVPVKLSWRLFAEILLIAREYE